MEDRFQIVVMTLSKYGNIDM